MNGYKRCKCRDADGKELGPSCPRLHRKDGSWNPSHGTWYGKAELPPAPDGTRAVLRTGGFASREEMSTWFEEAVRLILIPGREPHTHQARSEILALVQESRRRKSPLPSFDDLRMRYATGASFEPGTAGEYLTGWLARHKLAETWSPTTYLSYESACTRLFLPCFGAVPLDRLQSGDILAMFTSIDRENDRIRAARASADPAVRKSAAGRRVTSMATKIRILAVIRSALGEACTIAEGRPRVLTVNVAAGIKFGKGATSARSKPRLWTLEQEQAWRDEFERRAEGLGKRDRFDAWRNTAARPGPVMVWRPEHLGRFLDAAEERGSRLYALFTLVAYCAFRRGEACGQKWRDVNTEARAFMIGPTIVQVGWKAVAKDDAKTEGSGVWVKAADEVMAALHAQRQRQVAERLQWGPAWQDTGYVHTHEDGTPYHPEQVSGEFEQIAYAAGLPPVTLRDVRHCAPTFALSDGCDIKVVAEMMRHSSVKVTADLYALVLPELAAEVSRSVAAMIPRRKTARNSGAPFGLPGPDAAHHTDDQVFGKGL